MNLPYWCLPGSKISADSLAKIRIRLEQTIKMLEVDSEMFQTLYRFTFSLGLEPDKRILSSDMAISLWKLVFTVHTLMDNWLHFLEQHPSIRDIPKDTWNMFLIFSDVILTTMMIQKRGLALWWFSHLWACAYCRGGGQKGSCLEDFYYPIKKTF